MYNTKYRKKIEVNYLMITITRKKYILQEKCHRWINKTNAIIIIISLILKTNNYIL